MPILIRRCAGCGHVFELLDYAGVQTNLDRDENVEDLSCVECGGVELVGLTGKPMESSRKYPYFDHGLGREITSYKHWRATMSELGVVEAGGETRDWGEDAFQKDQSADEAAAAKYKAYVEEMSTGRNRGEWHKVLDVMTESRKAEIARDREEQAEARRQYERDLERWRSNPEKMRREAIEQAREGRRR
jgi:hypothetical protein